MACRSCTIDSSRAIQKHFKLFISLSKQPTIPSNVRRCSLITTGEIETSMRHSSAVRSPQSCTVCMSWLCNAGRSLNTTWPQIIQIAFKFLGIHFELLERSSVSRFWKRFPSVSGNVCSRKIGWVGEYPPTVQVARTQVLQPAVT